MNKNVKSSYTNIISASNFNSLIDGLHETSLSPEEYYKFGVRFIGGNEIKNSFPELKLGNIKNDITYILFSDLEVLSENNEFVNLSHKKFDKLKLIFINCNISDMYFYKCTFGVEQNDVDWDNVVIYNTQLNTIFFEECTLVGISLLMNTKPTYIDLKNCNISDVRIKNSSIGIVTLNNTKAGKLFVDESTITGLQIENNSLTEDLWINKENKTGYLYINGSTVGDFYLQQSITEHFNIEKSNTKDFYISESVTTNFYIEQSTTGFFLIQNSSTHDFEFHLSTIGDIEIRKSTTGNFSVYNSSSTTWDIEDVYASFIFSKTKLGECKLNNCHIHKLRIQNECNIELYINESIINLLDFKQLTLGKNSIISFSNSLIYSSSLDEFAVLGNLFFRNVKNIPKTFAWLQLNKHLKKSKKDSIISRNRIAKIMREEQKNKYIKEENNLLKLFPESTFRLYQSSLGKTEFTECDLKAFNFQFNNSKITEIFISGGAIPQDINVYNETNPIKILEQKKSFFDQLKKVFENQGDIVRGTEYHAKASEIQKSIIEKKIGDKPKWHQKYRNTEWLVYRLNEASNNHGQSWGKAIKFILWWSIPLYVLYWFFTCQLSLTGDWSWGLLGDSIGYYFSFLLPTHKIDFIPGADSNFGTMFFDFLGRILIGYGIYQLISAFRKHGKKV